MHLETLTDQRDELGEGPHWDSRSQTLLRVDVNRGQVRRLDPRSGTDTPLAVEAPIGFAVTSPDEILVVGVGHSIVSIDKGGQRNQLATVEDGNDDLRLNDAKCDRFGRLHFGSISQSREVGAGGLYRLAPDGAVEKIVSGVTISNGMGWDYTRDRFYYTDSWEQRVDVFDIDPADGHLGCRRPFIDVDPAIGLPDGMAVDVEGGIWVVMFFGGVVHRYDHEGKLTEVIKLPVSCPTSAAFGGEDLSILFITSSRHRLDAEQRTNQPLAGAVFGCEPGIAGVPVNGFG